MGYSDFIKLCIRWFDNKVDTSVDNSRLSDAKFRHRVSSAVPPQQAPISESCYTPTMHLEEPDLALVEQFFADRGLLAERIPKTTGKTPDFKILRDQTVGAFCEVKSPQDVFQERLNDAIRAAPEGQYRGVIESGPVSRQYRCMERAATKAAAQFNAVNPAHAQPNILMFVNHDTTSHQGDFEEAVTGCFRSVPAWMESEEDSRISIDRIHH